MSHVISETEGRGGVQQSESGHNQTAAWSYAQERNWFLEQAYPGHAQHRHAIGATIAGPLDVDALRAALHRVCARHDIFQRSFGPGANVPASPTLTLDSLSGEDTRTRWIAERSGTPFNPASEPMLRAHLLRIRTDEHVLLLVAHRYLLDEEGLGLLLHEIAADLAGTLPDEPARPRFADFIDTQRHNPQQAELLAHWRSRLAGAAPVLELPTDLPRPPIQAYAGASLPVDLSADLSDRLRSLANRHDVDLQAVLLAAFATLLQRHSGQGDLVIGLRSSYRINPALARLVGPLDNTLALRLDLSADPASNALLQLTGSALDDARRHAALPFEQLIEALQPARNLGYAPICQVLFDYRLAPPARLTAGKLTLQPFPIESASTAHDLGLRIEVQGDQLSGRLIYDPALFSAATAQRMAGHYRSLLDDLASDTPKPTSALRLLTDAEWQQLVIDWNATDADYPADSSLSRLFEAQAERTPDAPAILGPGPALSYRELDARANRLAHHLASLGVAHETLVGVSMERSPELFVAILAILKAGACYVPLDPGYPAARLTAMLEDTAVSLLLSKERWLDVLPPHTARVLCLDRDWPAIAAQPASRPPGLAGAASLAYVVFTSGSTGRPKGVMVEQRQLLNRFAWMWREYPFAPGDVSACKTALNFVDSLWELLGPLLHGVPSVLVQREMLLEPRAFVALLAEYRVTRMMLVPSLMRMMLDAHDDLAARLPLLRDWCIGGEPLTVELARRFARAMPGRLLLNLYGLSEAFDACYFDAGQLTDADTLVPIGRPLSNVQAYVLDAHRQPVPVGVIGELYVGGAGLARGYLGQPAMSAEKFLPNPFRDAPGSRIYRTGDLARLRPDGLIDYLGRSDHQVKIRGFRIEPDEVASVLRSHPDIAAAVVVVRPDDTGELALAAYFVARDSTPAIAPLQGWLRERLPDYMVPASYTPLAALPMTPSGKVDRLSLPAPDKRSAVASAYVAPADETEQIIARLWQDVLQIERVGSQDNFFDLGGTSLRMVQINRRLCDALQRAIPVLQMYQHPTVSSLARSLATDSSSAPASSAATCSPADRPPPGAVRAEHPTSEITMNPTDSDRNLSDIAIIGMSCRVPGADDVSALWRNLEQGVESISFFSEAELLAAGVTPETLADPAYVRAGAVIDNIDCFDAAFFGYSPREASLMEPQQRIFLECAWEALERAGYTPHASNTHGGAIGVFGGSAMNGYLIYNLATRPDVAPALFEFQVQIGNDKDYLASRVAYKLNLTGPSVVVQSACSTSLTAIHVACQSLLGGECNLALAGGISIAVPHRVGYLYQEGGVNSADGHCRAFDADARGTVLGSGVGIVALKRMADALADGDHIHAVIKGSAINNDGSAKVGFTAPSVDGQAAVVAEALAIAGIEADEIGYVETHGTATPMGDPIEVKALTQAFRESTDATGYCAIGSVKSNIGHLDVASGVAGLIKTALMLEHRRIPGTLHYRRANPEIDFASSPFYVNTALCDWQQPVRRAGVSSFGLGGTNAHVVMEEAPARAAAAASRPWQLILLSARNPEALGRMGERLAGHLEHHPDQPLADIAYTLQTGRQGFTQRRMLVVASRDDLASTLLSGERQRSADAICAHSNRPVVFMFPGQGAQYLGMGRGLYDSEPLFRAEVDRCCALLAPHLDHDLRSLMWPADSASAEALTATWIVQPALFVIEYALARLWMSWGVQPAAMIGHSIGEYPALCLAGVMSLPDALKLVAARGRLMQEMQPGSMLAVDLPENELGDLAARGLSLAGVNSPGRSVVAGPSDAIAAFRADMEARGQQVSALHTSHAFHSAMMDPMLERFAAVVASIALQAPQIPVVSNLSGTWLTAAQATDPAYYTQHLRHTVRFADGIVTAVGDGDPLLLEVGPGRTLGTLAQQCASTAGAKGALWSMRHPQQDEPDQAMLLTTLGKLWLAGVSVDWAGFYADETRCRVPLPGYPFERQRHWIEPGKLVAQAAGNAPMARSAPGKRPLADWFYTPAWKQSPLPDGGPAASGPWLIFTTGEGFAETLARDLEQAGQDVLRVLPGAKAGWCGERRYSVDPGQRADYDSLINALATAGKLPHSVLHAWNLGDAGNATNHDSFGRAQGLGFRSLLCLAQALGARDYTESVRIGVLGSGIQALTPTELPQPDRAPLVAACVVIAQEYSNLDARCFDIMPPAAGTPAEQGLARQILREMGSDAPNPVVAWRDGVRWVQDYRPLHLPATTENPTRLRQQGVYLITGGLGAIGFALAEDLAHSVQARLVLTGRSAMPAAAEWDALIATHGADHPVSQRIAKVRALEALGAEVLVVAADVADTAAMAGALEQARSRFGHIDGVIHGAGIVAEDAFLAVQDTSPENCTEHFRPKVDGLLVLHNLLKNDPPDFYVLLSSISAVVGGLGYAAYAAANRYLDAYAARQNRLGGTGGPAWLAIGWDAWQSAASRSDKRGMGAVVNEVALSTADGVDAFRRILASNASDTVLVSTTDLSTRIAHWVLRKPRASAAAASAAAAAPTVAYATAMQTAIAGIWQSALGVGHIEPRDNFFDLGGDSLLLMEVIARLKSGYGIVLNPREIMFQTLAQLAAVCEERQAAKKAGSTSTPAPSPVPATAPAPAPVTPASTTPAPEPERPGGLFSALKRKLRG